MAQDKQEPTGYIVSDERRGVTHSKTGKVYAYGEAIDLSHLKPAQIADLERQGVVAKADSTKAQAVQRKLAADEG